MEQNNNVLDMHLELLKRCRKGDRGAQMQVYHRYYKAMYNTALRIVKDTFEAEDLMQESFLTAFDQLENLLDLNTFSSWLKRIVVNKSVNALKQRTSYESMLNRAEFDEPMGENEYEIPFTVEQVKTAMNKLPDGYRIVLSLYLFEGYDHEEIAQILSISSGTSRSQYNRGRNQLKQLLMS